MSASGALWVHVGEARHGVHRYGVVLAGAAGRSPGSGQARVVDPSDPGAPGRLGAALRRLGTPTLVVQFTDRLWGPDPTSAARAFVDLVGAVDGAEPVVVLHDVPKEGEPERRQAYAAVASVGRCVVSSEHERRRLHGCTDRRADVVPHFVPAPPRPSRRRRSPAQPEVAVLGYVYPGKGHADVLAAAALAAHRPGVVALGGAAPGHADLLDGLADQARRSEVRFRTTGWLGEVAQAGRTSSAAVPVVANDDPSASGSLATWLGAGRRPLVRDSAYAREVDALAPGCLHRYPGDDPEALARSIDDALARPWTTWTARVPAELAPTAIAARIVDGPRRAR